MPHTLLRTTKMYQSRILNFPIKNQPFSTQTSHPLITDGQINPITPNRKLNKLFPISLLGLVLCVFYLLIFMFFDFPYIVFFQFYFPNFSYLKCLPFQHNILHFGFMFVYENVYHNLCLFGSQTLFICLCKMDFASPYNFF